MDPIGDRDGYVIMDREGRVVVASTRFAELAGCAPKELVGHSFANLFDPCQHTSIMLGIETLAPRERFERVATLARAERRVPVWLLVQRMLEDQAYAGARCALVAAAPARNDRARPPLPTRRAAPEGISGQVLLAQESERKRIAADLHDGLGQLLSAAKFGVESAMGALSQEANGDAKGTLVEVAATVKQALEEVRRIAMNLRPSTLDDLGILATLSWFLREFRSIYRSIEVETDFAIKESDVPDALKVAIFRVVQEAMSNVAKHSRASRARVSLDRRGGGLHLVIEDDGIGFDPLEVASRKGLARRFGHCCARERVEAGGGSLTLRAAPGGGVNITIFWPLITIRSGTEHGGSLAHIDRRGSHVAAHRITGAAFAGPGIRSRRGS